MMLRQHIRVLVCFIFVALAAVSSAIWLPKGGPLTGVASAQEPLWQEVTDGSLDTLSGVQQSGLVPERYKAFRLNEAALSTLLDQAPMEFTDTAKDLQNEIMLPMPDGGFARFRFVQSPIMEPQLAAQFPEIKTYRGWGIDDPAATVRFDRTITGFHAFVLSPADAFYITPLFARDTHTYASYYMRDAGGDIVSCSVGPDDRRSTLPDQRPLNRSERQSPFSANALNDGSLRTFRLAVAATAEYTAASGGTVQKAMSNISTTVNNINLIYQKEMSVSLSLVGNPSIIFTNTNTDGYTSGNQNQLIVENQQTLDLLMGQSSYDIGHVFDANSGGGLASIGVVCANGTKAQGASSGIPVSGVGFDLLVAHEFGHQFGANHTFNGTAGNCGSPGQLNVNTAYEPGSGSTIMAYAGTCGSDDIQRNPDPYFHGESLKEMADYIAVHGCASTTNINNTPPAVTIPTPPSGAFLVPKQTPFTLTGSATDAEDTNLTYCWEERDRGAPGPPTGDRGINPLFRSFPPTSNPSRTFPQMADVLSGTPTPGETMPTTQRELSFLLTARDNHSSGGAFASRRTLVIVQGLFAGPFVVTQPAAGTQALEGHLMTVNWDVAGTNAAPINTADVRILLSTDNGTTFPTTLATGTLNDGSFTFTVPRANTDEARIMVKANGNIYFNVSPAFSIIPKPTITATGSLTITEGSASVTAPVAVVADERDAAGSLSLRPLQPLPNGVTLSATNSSGIVSVTGTARCGSHVATHRIALEVTNSAGLHVYTYFSLVVERNQVPTLGDYNNANVVAGQVIDVLPSSPPSDPNGNLDRVTASIVTPTPLPTDGTILPVNNTDGIVRIFTFGTARLQTYQIEVRATDSCGRYVTKGFLLNIVNSPPQITSIGNSVRTTQGGLPAPPSIGVATVSDQQDTVGALSVSATAPPGLTVIVTNSNGTIMATAMATCTVPVATHTATLTVIDSAGARASTTFPIIIDRNPPPTLGAYLDSGVTVGGSVLIVPNVPPSDPNNNASNAVSLTVNPVILPGGGQVTVNPSNGRVTVNTVATTTLNTYQIYVTAQDSCFEKVTRSFRLTVRSATCVAEQSAVFVADTGNHRIQRFSGGAWNIIGAGTQGNGLGQFISPESVVASPDGRKIYVADTGNRRIQWSQDSGGSWAVFASNLASKGLVLDRDGNLYASDAQDNRVLRYSGGVSGTPIVLAASGSGAGQVRNPNGLAIDCRMNLYIADTGNNRILVIATADSAVLPNTGTVVAGPGAGSNPAQVTAPQGVAVDSAGRLYIADTGNDRVLMMTSTPLAGPATVLCTGGAAVGQVSDPEGVTVAAFAFGPLAGGPSILVSDTTNNRIQGRPVGAGSWMLLPPQVGQFTLPSKIR